MAAEAVLGPVGMDADPRASLRVKRAESSTILKMVGRRALQAIPVLIGSTLLTFSLMTLLPGTTALALLGPGATPEAVAALDHKLGTDRPFVVQYGTWLWHAVQGNLGASLSSGQPISSILAQRLPVSIELVALSFLISVVFAIPVAILAARRPGGIVDRVTLFLTMGGLAMPSFVLGLLLILVFAVTFKVIASEGFAPFGSSPVQNLKLLLLPCITLASPFFCHYVRILRADLVDQLNSGDYVVTARAKGLKPSRVLVQHVLRNSIFGVVTLMALNLGQVIGQTVLIEQIFNIPGVGSELFQAVSSRDITIVLGIVSVLVVAVVVANMLADVLTLILDPRVRYGQGT